MTSLTDRSTKVLLVLIAVALWGILLRPVFTPAPAQAQAQTTAQEHIAAPQQTKTAPVMQVFTFQAGGQPVTAVFVVADGYVSMYRVIDGTAGPAHADNKPLELKPMSSQPLPARKQ